MIKNSSDNIMIVMVDERLETEKKGIEQYNLDSSQKKHSKLTIIAEEKGSYKLTAFIKWRGKIYKSQHFKYTVN